VKVAVITISDRASRGEYEDLSGPEIEKLVRTGLPGAEVTRAVVPDEADRIREALEAAAAAPADFILTTGGTGISPRDITPQVTREFCQVGLPGIAEALRAASLSETPSAMLSRGEAGMRGKAIVVNFPGSVKAVRLCTTVLLPVMEHALRMRDGQGH
jgi:molybdenum cofactor synthesis domain-containing protein